jgi:sugar-specific transcriptional regulator TrmB
MKDQLQRLGLSDEEAELYLAMLELGGGYASQLAKRVGRNRSSMYHTLKTLTEKGLITKLAREKHSYFSPEPPEKIVQLAKLRYEGAASLLPELQSIQNTIAAKPKIKFYQHTSGIESIFEDTLSAEGEILGYTNLSLLVEMFPGYFKRYTEERMRRKIKVRYLSPRPTSGPALLEDFFTKLGDSDLLEVLFVNPTQFPVRNEVAIYGNKVALMSLSADELIGVLIESPNVAQTMKAGFDLAWIGAASFIAQ